MNPPLVSCIIPVHNGARYLAEAVASIRGQTHRTVEILIVDDASTDGTAEVIQGLGAEIRSFALAQQSGPAAARNEGLRHATGDFIAFLDADDLWRPRKLEMQLELLNTRPDLGGCVTLIRNFWVPELQEEAERYRDHPIAQAVPGFLTQTLLTRRAAFDQVGPLNQVAGAGDATEWFLRAEDAGVKIELLAELLVDRRLHQANRSRRLGDQPRTVLLRFLKQSLDRKRHADASRIQSNTEEGQSA